MKNKIKILSTALIILSILIGGCFILKQRNICGPSIIGVNYNTSYCDRSCVTDEDCKFTCACWAINKNEECHWEGMEFDCIYYEVKCEKGKCVEGDRIIPPPLVAITTDKTEYEQGETIKITMINNLNYTVYMRREDSSKYYGENYGIGFIYRLESWGWEKAEPIWRCGNSCFSKCEGIPSLEPGKENIFYWNQTVLTCDENSITEKIEYAQPGEYMINIHSWFEKDQVYNEFSYSCCEFTIK